MTENAEVGDTYLLATGAEGEDALVEADGGVEESALVLHRAGGLRPVVAHALEALQQSDANGVG